MNEVWKATTDFRLIAQLHQEWNPGLWCCLDEYSHLGPSDLRLRKAKSWITPGPTERGGYALAIRQGSDTIFEELWTETTGSPEPGLPLESDDDLLLRETYELLTRSGNGGVVLRFPSDNPLGVWLASRYNMRLGSTLLLSTRTPVPVRCLPLHENYTVRGYRTGDETAYCEIHRECFGTVVPPNVYRKWARKPSCESFSVLSSGRTVGLLIAEARRGGEFGDFNIAIREGYRHRGIGTALIAEAMRSFRRRGVKKVVADHWATNGRAVSFYKRFGFHVERAYHFFRVK